MLWKDKTMKRFLLLTVVLALFAGQANAAMYALTEAYALTLDDVAYSDAGGSNSMPSNSPTTNNTTYNGGGPMQEEVGFFGGLDDTSGDGYAWVKMGDPDADLNLDLSAYTDYLLYVANDDQDKWDVALHLTAGGTEYTSAWTELAPVSDYDLVLNFASAGIPTADLDDITDIGFYIRGHLIGPGTAGYPSDPDFYHISVVPVPAAVLLGLLGLGVAGWKLRRFA
jgi:hypothetical protein